MAALYTQGPPVAYTTGPVEVAFELTDADLHEVQRHRVVLWRRLVRSRKGILGVTLVAGVLCWPLGRLLLTDLPWPFTPTYLVAVAVAGAVVQLIAPRLTGLRARRVEHWALRRRAAIAVKRSVLGPVTLVLTATAIKRLRPGAEALVLPGREVKRLTASPTLLVMHLPGRKVLVAPRRAFPSDAEALEFQRRVEGLTGKTAEVIGQGD